MTIIQNCLILFVISSSTNADNNLALHRPAYLSSTYLYGLASSAVDGSYSCTFPNVAHNNDAAGGPNWLIVDLGREYYVQSVVLTGRSDCCEYTLDQFIVGVTNIFDPMTNPPIRNTYPLCGQYPSTASRTEKMYLNCSSNTLPGKFVIIQQPLNGRGALTICELEVYGYASTDTNLAAGRPVYQSSTLIKSGFTYSAGLAVDGNADSNFTHNHCSSTKDNISDTDQWFVVDLGRIYRIQFVTLTKQTDNCCDNFIVGITNEFPANKIVSRSQYSICGKFEFRNTSMTDQLTVQCDPSTRVGRCVIIQQPVNGSGFLTICELEVYVYGENLATGRQTYSSSVYNDPSYNASKAVDGIFERDFRIYNAFNADSNNSDRGQWFVVDLSQKFYVQRVTLVSRGDCCPQLDNFIVGLTNNFSSNFPPVRNLYNLCGQYPAGATQGGRLTVFCDAAAPPSRYVIVQQPNNPPQGYLTIVEIEVYCLSHLENRYVGCYRNIPTTNISVTGSAMTIESCIMACKQRDTTFAALQNGDSCICADEAFNSAPDSECHHLCTGSTNQYCGGNHLYAIYTVCPKGYFGPTCSEHCHCNDQRPCNIRTGYCSNECDETWSSSQCNQYAPGGTPPTQYLGCFIDDEARDFTAYSKGFQYASPGLTLDFSKSTCIGKGYIYTAAQLSWLFCDEEYGKYGLALSDGDCGNKCDGDSSQICGGRYRNSVYSVICPNGTYGMSCSEKCHCANQSSCYADGRCKSRSCEHGWIGARCNIKDYSVNNGACDQNETCGVTELLFASVTRCDCKTGYRRLQHWNVCTDIDECQNHTSCNNSSETCSNTIGGFRCECLTGFSSSSPDVPYSCRDINECIQGNPCDTSSGKCVNTDGDFYCECFKGYNSTDAGKGCQDQINIPPSKSPVVKTQTDEGGKIAGAVIGSLIIVAIIVVAVIMFVQWRRKRKGPPENGDQALYDDKVIHFVALTTSCIPIEHLERYVGENQNEIEKQYQEIPTQTEESCSCGTDVELKPKNRFKNVIPYDSNRVLLQTIEGQELSHYINASYITNCNSNFKDVIAAQGPNDHTVPDFWRMICEQNVSVIVMITDLFENGKQKCSRYWPESKQESFGDITVTLTEVKTWPRFVIRHLKVGTENVDKEVIQLQYLKWPDHGVPDNVGSFLNFRRKARASMSPDTRTVVHCSAGIGRTGVFIAVDYLLEQAKAEKRVDVKECLKTLRDQRPQMIQTVTQYKFVYTALVTDLSLGDTTIPLDDNFSDKMTELQASPKSGMCQLERQFEILTEGSRDRTVSLADKFMVTLSKSEIDAVYLSNFRRPDAFVVGQMPPNINLEDFLKLCTNDSKFLVYVDDLPEERLSFLPSDGNATHNLKGSKVSICEKRKDEFGTPYSIKVEKDEEDLYANAEESENNIYANSGSQTSDLTLLHVTTIQKNTIGCDAVTSVSKRIETVLNDENYKGIPVLSRSGHDLAAFLVAGNNILEMARLHNEVDLFQIVYEMKRVQPTFIPTYDSYKELHDFVGEYLSGASYETINQKAYHSGLAHRSIFPGQGEEMYANVQANGMNLC